MHVSLAEATNLPTGFRHGHRRDILLEFTSETATRVSLVTAKDRRSSSGSVSVRGA